MGSLIRTISFGRFRWWSRAALLAIVYWLTVVNKWSDTNSATADINNFAEDAFGYIRLIILLGLLIAFGLFLRIRQQNKALDKQARFETHPWMYQFKIIQMTLKVEYIFPNSIERKFKRRVTNLRRNLTGNKDHSNRHVHLKFLASSPYLKKKEKIVVFHSIELEPINLRKGQLVVVQGEYVHKPSQKRGFLGFSKSHFYGLIHYTHAPKGFIRPAARDEMIKPFFPRKPKKEQQQRVANL